MNVRLATKEDIPDISQIVSMLDTEVYNYSNLSKIERYVDRKTYYVLEKDSDILAAMCIILTEQSYQLFLIASKTKGGGKNLIDYLVEKCKEEEIKKVWCWSLARYNAKGFYEKMGFDEQYLLKNQWHNEDCYFFGKNIE